MSTIFSERPAVTVTVPPRSGNLPTQDAQPAMAVEDFMLGSLQHPSVRLKRELKLQVRRTRERVLIVWPDADLTVEAQSLTLAVDRFRRLVAEQFLRFTAQGAVPQHFAEAMRTGRV